MAVNVQPVPPNREYNETVRRFLDLLRRQVNTNTGGIQDIIDSLSAYTLVDGSRPFTAPVGGVTPVASTDLTTKAYVDGLVSGSGFWQRNGTVLSPVNVGDSLVVDSTIDLKTKLKFTSATAEIEGVGTTVIGTNTTDVVLTAKGVSGQTANLQEWQDSIGTNLAHISNEGRFGQGGFDVLSTSDAQTNGVENTYLGEQAGNFSGVNAVVAVGYQAGVGATGGSVSVGHLAQANATSTNSIGIGRSALRVNSQNNCVGVGSYVMQNNTGTNTVGFGGNTLESNTGNLCSAFGGQAMRNNTGDQTNAFGFQTLNVNEGNYSNGFGYRVLLNHTTGGNNSAFGHEAGFNNITGSGLVLLGYEAGYNETGSNKLYISNSQTNNLIYGEFDNKILKVNGELQSTAKRETKVTSSTTETLSVLDSTYINIDTAGNTLSLSNMVDGSKMQINNSSAGDATLNFDIKYGTSTFTAPVTMPSGDSYELVYDSGSSTWVM